jgi:hypothetical protein
MFQLGNYIVKHGVRDPIRITKRPLPLGKSPLSMAEAVRADFSAQDL